MAEQLVVLPDSQQPLDLIARMLIDPGDNVVVENPGYSGAREIFTSQGAHLSTVPVDENGLVVERLHQTSPPCKIAYITPSHHDPTGAVLSLDRRRRLLSWAKDNNVLIVEDAFDSDFRYGSQPIPALQSLDLSVPVIYMYSFWKVLFPICSLGCIVLPPSLIEVFAKAKLLMQRHAPVVDYLVLTEFLSDGHIERHIHKTRAIYTRRRQTLIFALARNFRTEVGYYKETAGLHLLVRFKQELSDLDIEECAKLAGLPLVSTRAFYVENPVANEFLLPFASIPEETAADMVERMADLMRIRVSQTSGAA